MYGYRFVSILLTLENKYESVQKFLEVSLFDIFQCDMIVGQTISSFKPAPKINRHSMFRKPFRAFQQESLT